MSEIGIVGGGVLGLTLALRLRAQGHAVTVLEGAAQAGGLAAPQSIGGVTWDRFYHVILLSDRHLRDLLEELGLADQLRWGTTRTGFYIDGRMHSLSTSLDFLRFPPLTLIDKARLAATILYASRIEDGRPLELVPVTEWLQRWSGRRTFERIWLPLLKSKLGENYRVASAAFIWAIIARMYAARRSGIKREMFGYVEGGYDRVLRRLRERLEERGITLVCGQPVTRVRRSPDASLAPDDDRRVHVELADGRELGFDDVVLTVPTARAAKLCPQFNAAEVARLLGITYQGIVCASVLLTRPLATYYVTNITESWVPFTAVIEMTTLVDPAAFGGRHLVYLPRYLTQDHPDWQLDDATLREQFLTALERMYPDFRREQVLAFEVSRVREVLAVSTLDYTARCLPPLVTSLPGVYLANSAQIANGTLNLNETVALANAQAAALAPRLATRARVTEPARS
ncbi:MAG: NAD(P)/FAD-dependent oxidoreductase [Gemmatimonadales bacterium]